MSRSLPLGKSSFDSSSGRISCGKQQIRVTVIYEHRHHRISGILRSCYRKLSDMGRSMDPNRDRYRDWRPVSLLFIRPCIQPVASSRYEGGATRRPVRHGRSGICYSRSAYRRYGCRYTVPLDYENQTYAERPLTADSLPLLQCMRIAHDGPAATAPVIDGKALSHTHAKQPFVLGTRHRMSCFMEAIPWRFWHLDVLRFWQPERWSL